MSSFAASSSDTRWPPRPSCDQRPDLLLVLPGHGAQSLQVPRCDSMLVGPTGGGNSSALHTEAFQERDQAPTGPHAIMGSAEDWWFGGPVRSARGSQEGAIVSDDRGARPRPPPRWFIRLFWSAHRAVCQHSGGRGGAVASERGRWGTARLTDNRAPHRSAAQRDRVGYFEDGPNLVTLASETAGPMGSRPGGSTCKRIPPRRSIWSIGSRPVKARAAEGEERSRLWARWARITGSWTPMRRCGRPRLRS